ncbi:MAG: M48 family metallopeptidase [Nitrospirae bacterium]|nr:M48 family metallopeptidase [Nitrospirota bacterium]
MCDNITGKLSGVYYLTYGQNRFEEKNHSKIFWNKIKIMLPDYEQYKDWLKKINICWIYREYSHSRPKRCREINNRSFPTKRYSKTKSSPPNRNTPLYPLLIEGKVMPIHPPFSGRLTQISTYYLE